MFSPILSPIPIPLASVTVPPFVAALGTATKALPLSGVASWTTGSGMSRYGGCDTVGTLPVGTTRNPVKIAVPCRGVFGPTRRESAPAWFADSRIIVARSGHDTPHSLVPT